MTASQRYYLVRAAMSSFLPTHIGAPRYLPTGTRQHDVGFFGNLRRQVLATAMGLRHKLNAVRQGLTTLLIVFITRQISFWLPADRWYSAALQSSKLLTRSFSAFAPNTRSVPTASLVPRMLHRHLDIMATRGRYFHIPTVVEGLEYLVEYAAQPEGFVCCSAHIPFIKLAFPLIREHVGPNRPMRIVSRDPSGQVTGWNDASLDIIRADQAVLLHTRSFLRRNGCLLLAVDKDQGDFISANIFRFVGKLHSRVLMFFTQLQPDGRILLRIMVPPGPRCESEQAVRANLDLVSENIGRILRGDQITEGPELPPRSLHNTEPEGSREIHRIQLYSSTQLEARIRRIQSMLEERSNSGEDDETLRERLALMLSELEMRTGV